MSVLPDVMETKSVKLPIISIKIFFENKLL